jgi:hypothetical protein
MARVTRMWKISRAGVYRSLKETPPNTIAGLGLVSVVGIIRSPIRASILPEIIFISDRTG